MSIRAVVGPVLAGVVAVTLGALFFDGARLPDLFPWSGVILPALLTGVLALGLTLMLPEKLFFTRAEHLKVALYTGSGLEGIASERVIEHVERARDYAARLRASASDMREDAAEMTTAAAEDLEELADRLFAEPGRAQSATSLINRARLVVDAVENFVSFKQDAGAEDAKVENARDRIMESLTQMSGAAEAVHTRLARQKYTNIEVATEVADGLFGRQER